MDDRPSGPGSETTRNQLIDVLRGTAILLVVCTHFPLFWYSGRVLAFGRTQQDVRDGLGYYGVSIFFVISGFLITQVTLRRYRQLNRIDCSAFWWMRIARIVPLLLLALLAMVAFHYLAVPGFRYQSANHLWRSVTAALSFRYPDMLGHADNGPWGPLWSLSIEEMFYLFFGLVALAINGFPAALWIASAVIATSVYLGLSGQASPYGFTGCMDLLALGCLLSLCRPERLKDRLGPRKTAALGTSCAAAGLALILFILFFRHPFSSPCAPFVSGLGAGLFLLASQWVGLRRWMSRALWPVSALGVVSYEVYLLHAPVRAYADSLPGADLSPWLELAAVVILAWVTHRIFSEPVNQSLRAWRTGRRPALRGSRAFLAAASPAVAIVLAGAISDHLNRPLVVPFTIEAIGNVPSGSAEPLVETGREGVGDLVYLQHLPNRTFRVGIDHWGGPLILSRPLRADQLLHAGFRAIFNRNFVEVTLGPDVIAACPVGCYDPCSARIGVNDAHFSTALPRAASTIVRPGS